MSHFTLSIKMRNQILDISVPQTFKFYRFGNPKSVRICAVCPEGVAVEITSEFSYKKSKPAKKFLAHSTVYNYFSFAIPNQ